MASLSLFLIERHSCFWLLRLLTHRSHQAKLPILSRMECGKRRWSKFKVSTAGRLYHSNVKFAESSTQTVLFEQCHDESFAVSKRVSAQDVGCCSF